MKISIDSFGGNKDNYYNFKQNFIKAREGLNLANLYIPQCAPGEIDKLISDGKILLHNIEFED
jgi:hypothetical protein